MDLKEIEQIDDGFVHWYYQSKFNALYNLIKNIPVQEVIDVGAGSGVFCKMLLSINFCESAYCLDTGYKEETTNLINGRRIKFIKKIDTITQDLVLFMDVLEHVDDDVGFLRDYVSKMKEGKYVLISVPAFKFIWSHHDEFLEHKRRYSLNQLERVVSQSGLDIVDTKFFFSTIFPLVALFRMIDRFKKNKNNPRSDLSPCHPLLNRLLINMHHFECNTFFKFNKLFGLSIFCLGRVPICTSKSIKT